MKRDVSDTPRPESPEPSAFPLGQSHPMPDARRHLHRAPNPAVAWLFDIDGVLTSPELKIVTQPIIYQEIIRRLQAGAPIGFNTGRSLWHVVERVLAPLEDQLKDKQLLSSVIAVGEKGATWITYQEDGIRVEYLDSRVVVPSELREAIWNLSQRPEFSDSMFFDETKRTMISIELRDGTSLTDFATAQAQLVMRLSDLLERYALVDQFKIDPTVIATDVEHKGVGKGLGAARFLELLERKGIHPQSFVCFGDSVSDYGMFEEIVRQGKQAHLVFVGGRERLREKETHGVTFTQQLYDAGTLEYLTSHEM